MEEVSFVFENIGKHVDLDKYEKERIASELSFAAISRKQLILRQGQRCKELFFIVHGSFRAFHLGQDGKDSTIMFGVKDWWITDMHGFIKQQQALVSIEALEDSKVLILNFDVFDKLLQEVPKMERFFRIIFQHAYVREQLRALNSLSLDTEHRYYEFLGKYPQIVEKVTQKQIASYLGVTPEFLSSIKKKEQTLKLS